jgi:myo-inositol-1(or 4)-monophosphatase
MWDYAAGSLILQEAGGVFSTLAGNALNCKVFTKRSAVAAINDELYRDWFRWLRENDDRGA